MSNPLVLALGSAGLLNGKNDLRQGDGPLAVVFGVNASAAGPVGTDTLVMGRDTLRALERALAERLRHRGVDPDTNIDLGVIRAVLTEVQKREPVLGAPLIF